MNSFWNVIAVQLFFSIAVAQVRDKRKFMIAYQMDANRANDKCIVIRREGAVFARSCSKESDADQFYLDSSGRVIFDSQPTKCLGVENINGGGLGFLERKVSHDPRLNQDCRYIQVCEQPGFYGPAIITNDFRGFWCRFSLATIRDRNDPRVIAWCNWSEAPYRFYFKYLDGENECHDSRGT